MRKAIGDYEIDDDVARVDLATVHRWLAGSYWSPGVAREVVERAAKYSSLVIGVYRAREQVGYARVVSDRATFAWVADVYVDEGHRGRGLGREMIRFALEHPEHQGLRRWLLATKDAHGVYAGVGFGPLDKPESMMIHRPGGHANWEARLEWRDDHAQDQRSDGLRDRDHGHEGGGD